MPSPEQREYAAVLLRRARSDLEACRVLASNETMADDVVGFHAQQSVEKALKTVLVLSGVDFPRTHDLDFLVALVRDTDRGIRDEIAGATWLSPWAAQLRYDEATGALDRGASLKAAEAAVGWAADVAGRG